MPGPTGEEGLEGSISCGYNVETWPDNPRPDDYRVRGVCGAGAVVTFPRIGPADAERKEPQFERSMMRSCGECPVPVTGRGTQTLVSFAPLAFKLFCAACQNAVLHRSPFPPA